MDVEQALNYIAWAFYLFILIVVTLETLRRPLKTDVDITLYFLANAGIILINILIRSQIPVPTQLLSDLSLALILALPYLMLRLVDDFAYVPAALRRLAAASLAILIVTAFLLLPDLPIWYLLAVVVYFVGLEAYSAVAFVREAGHSSGVTRRRMHAAAIGTALVGFLILWVGLLEFAPTLEEVGVDISQVLVLASSLAYFVAFAPPRWLRQAWQQPELRAFLGRAARLPQLPDTAAIVAELESGAALALGASGAAIGIWDPHRQVLRYQPVLPTSTNYAPSLPNWLKPDGAIEMPPDILVGHQAFREQRTILVAEPEREDPTHADLYRSANIQAILSAPITAGEKRLGVLNVFARQIPIFADDDLALVRLLADQAAVILESRALIDQAANIQAREEATRLKDDFLSSAAHDLKTPLTAIVVQSQLLLRRAERRQDDPKDIRSLERLVNESNRLRRFVNDLLDVSRAERGQIIGERKPVDLAEVLRAVVERHSSQRHQVDLELDGPVSGLFDSDRIEQVFDNLIENAIKYSPKGGKILLKLYRQGNAVQFSVSDFGIGIPEGDLPMLFDRFHRGTNVNDRKFAGVGLGLYLCRRIVEEHGGHIHATSALGKGTTFEVTLPIGDEDG